MGQHLPCCCYRFGRGAPQDISLAMVLLSECYRLGRGVEVNINIAEELLEEAAYGDYDALLIQKITYGIEVL